MFFVLCTPQASDVHPRGRNAKTSKPASQHSVMRADTRDKSSERQKGHDSTDRKTDNFYHNANIQEENMVESNDTESTVALPPVLPARQTMVKYPGSTDVTNQVMVVMPSSSQAAAVSSREPQLCTSSISVRLANDSNTDSVYKAVPVLRLLKSSSVASVNVQSNRPRLPPVTQTESNEVSSERTAPKHALDVMDCLMSVGQLAVDKSVELGQKIVPNLDTTLPDGRDLLDMNNTADIAALMNDGKSLDALNLDDFADSPDYTYNPNDFSSHPRIQITELSSPAPSTTALRTSVTANSATTSSAYVHPTGHTLPKNNGINAQQSSHVAATTDQPQPSLRDLLLSFGAANQKEASSVPTFHTSTGNIKMVKVTSVGNSTDMPSSWEDRRVKCIGKPPPAHTNNDNCKKNMTLLQQPEAVDLRVNSSGTSLAQLDGIHDSDSGSKDCSTTDGENTVDGNISVPSSKNPSKRQRSSSANVALPLNTSPTQPNTPPMVVSSSSSTAVCSHSASLSTTNTCPTCQDLSQQDLSQLMNDTGHDQQLSNEGVIAAGNSDDDTHQEQFPFPSGDETPSSVVCDFSVADISYEEYQDVGYRNISSSISPYMSPYHGTPSDPSALSTSQDGTAQRGIEILLIHHI